MKKVILGGILFYFLTIGKDLYSQNRISNDINKNLGLKLSNNHSIKKVEEIFDISIFPLKNGAKTKWGNFYLDKFTNEETPPVNVNYKVFAFNGNIGSKVGVSPYIRINVFQNPLDKFPIPLLGFALNSNVFGSVKNLFKTEKNIPLDQLLIEEIESK